MKIKVICIGKIKDSYIQEGLKEFQKRLKSKIQIEMIDLSDEKHPASIGQDKLIALESKKIKKSLPQDYYVVALDEKGNQKSSIEFSSFIEDIKDFQGGKLCFVIGGPFGLSEEIKDKADFVLSFSKMTFTHDFIRLMLIEQIYRAFEIIKKSKYHK